MGATEAGREEGKTNAAEAGDPTKAKNAEEEQKGEKAQPAAAAAKEAVEKQEEGGNAGPSGNPAPEDAKAGAQGNPAEAKNTGVANLCVSQKNRARPRRRA